MCVVFRLILEALRKRTRCFLCLWCILARFRLPDNLDPKIDSKLSSIMVAHQHNFELIGARVVDMDHLGVSGKAGGSNAKLGGGFKVDHQRQVQSVATLNIKVEGTRADLAT